MGAGVSRMDGGERPTGLGELPERCVAEVLLRLDPPEIGRLARLSRTFRAAASADFVWEAKMPGNYRYLMGEALGEESSKHGFGKSEIFAKLCRPNRLDADTKEFWLEKYTGGFCMLISAKALSITGIDDGRYWNYIPTNESRFRTVAYLQHIWWVEVCGGIEFCFPEGTYSLFFRLHLGRATKQLWRRVCSHEHIHGWDKRPAHLQLSTSDGQHAQCKRYLREPGHWILYRVGDFVVENSSAPTKVKFSLTQIDCTHTKGGLCVDSVLICPKGLTREKILHTFK